jgi:ABC-type nickel/cobalt efflux system permease component RcnA
MKKPVRFFVLLLVFSVSFSLVPTALAHPLGNFTINHYAGIEISPQQIGVDYILDMAELPAFQELAAMDADQDGKSGPEEMDRARLALCETVRSGLELKAGGRILNLSLGSSSLALPPGQGGLLTLRLSCSFSAPLPAGKNSETIIEFQSRSYAERLGWREIIVSGQGVHLQGDFSTSSLSNRLQSYPDDLLSNPPDQRQVRVSLLPEGRTSPQENRKTPVEGSPPQPARSQDDRFTALVMQGDLTPVGLLVALLISVAWGAAHALTPGHGKTIVGAYLVGSRGTAKHALYLGLTTTVTHTFGVFILGLVTLFASRYILTERLFPWLSFLSGLMVVVIGVNLFISRLRSAKGRPGHTHHPDAHSHDHADGHDHPHGAEHEHPHLHQPGEDHEHDHDHQHDHHHGHSHLPPGADGAPVNWRSLLALGVSGGLLPCPSALVVLLGAIAVDRIAFGLVLVFAFSLGLAGVLTGIGVIFVYSRRLFDRSPAKRGWLQLLPAASALFISLAGVMISARALLEIWQ